MIPIPFIAIIFVLVVASLFLPPKRRRSRSSPRRTKRRATGSKNKKSGGVPPLSPEERGAIGERDIAIIFEKLSQVGFTGAAIRNVYVPKEDGTYSEIDVVYVCGKGLVVVESKNYSGWIFGKEDEFRWTQRLASGVTNSFINPIKQNEGHVRYLKRYLVVPIEILPIVVFSDSCELKSSPRPAVIRRGELFDFIVKKWRFAPDVLSGEQILAVASKLEKLTNVSDEVRNAHVARVSELQRR